MPMYDAYIASVEDFDIEMEVKLDVEVDMRYMEVDIGMASPIGAHLAPQHDHASGIDQASG